MNRIPAAHTFTIVAALYFVGTPCVALARQAVHKRGTLDFGACGTSRTVNAPASSSAPRLAPGSPWTAWCRLAMPGRRADDGPFAGRR